MAASAGRSETLAILLDESLGLASPRFGSGGGVGMGWRDPNGRDRRMKRTPLHCAAAAGALDCAKILLDVGASPGELSPQADPKVKGLKT